MEILPPNCDDPEFVKTLNDKPGILALAMKQVPGGLEALPFIVPGARFNEKYGWDSVSCRLPSAADNSTLWRLDSWSTARLTLQ